MVKAILFSSGNLFALARSAYLRSKEEGSEAVASLILAASAIEGFINELSEISGVGNESRPEVIRTLKQVLSDLEEQRVQVVSKIQVAHFILTGKSIDKGSPLYQDYALLVNLRNALVHMKPEVFDHDLDPSRVYEPHKLMKRLHDRKIVPMPPGSAAPQLYAYLHNSSVAYWAYNTAISMVRFLVGLYPEGGARQQLISMTQHLKEEKSA